MVGSTTLNGESNDLSGLLVGFLSGLRLDLLDHLRGLVTYFLLHIGEDNGSGLFHSQSGNPLQFGYLVLVKLVNLSLGFFNALLFIRNLLFLALQGINLFIQRFLFLQQSPFLSLNFITTLTNVFFSFGAETVNLVLRFHNRFFLQCIGFLLSTLDNLLSCLLCTGNFRFSNRFADKETDPSANESSHERDYDGDDDIIRHLRHLLVVSPRCSLGVFGF
ncbi:hypothetical protein D3C75_824610 [compost metagenome]